MPHELKKLKFAIIIPAFNEEQHIQYCLDSLLQQSLLPEAIIVVDDSSTDNTTKIIQSYAKLNPVISYVLNSSSSNHAPGSKVVKAFNKGLENIDINTYDILCKFDADLIFPKHYLSEISLAFKSNSNLGLYGGVCSIKIDDEWETENLTNIDHVRGALKAYRVKAFKDISGLQEQMGWDTADEFKLRSRGWQVTSTEALQVKHLKDTGVNYSKDYFKKQGEVFYTLRYGVVLCTIAGLKIAKNKGNIFSVLKVLKSYFNSKHKNLRYLITPEEGKFLRKYRWQQIFKKLRP